MTSEAETDLETLARQTKQGRLLRDARDRIAFHAQLLAEKNDRKALAALGLDDKRIEQLRAGAAFNSADLAALLGVSLPALRSWMAPADNAVHREMPKTAKLLLERILGDIA